MPAGGYIINSMALGVMMMKKNNLLLNFMICWLGWGIPMGFLCSIIYGSLLKGFALGIAGGILFAGIMIAFIVILSARIDKLRKRYGMEGTVLYDGVANHLINKKAVGGCIFLMEDRFCFAPHLLNSTVEQWSVPYSDIAGVTNGRLLRSIAVHLKNGETEEFVVNNRKVWISILKQQIM